MVLSFLLMLTEGVKAIGVTKVGGNQFHEKNLTAKVVAPAGELASPVTFLYATEAAHARTGKRPAIIIDTNMMTFHEWLRERQQQEGLLLSIDGRLKGISPLNPLPKDSAFNKSLKQKPKTLPSGVPTFKPWKAAQPARFVPYKPAQSAKVTVQK